MRRGALLRILADLRRQWPGCYPTVNELAASAGHVVSLWGQAILGGILCGYQAITEEIHQMEAESVWEPEMCNDRSVRGAKSGGYPWAAA